MKCVLVVFVIFSFSGCLFFGDPVENNGATTNNSTNNTTNNTTNPTNNMTPNCGDKTRNQEEECDGNDLGGADCNSQDPTLFGDPACTEACTLDFAVCKPIPEKCGDGTLDDDEICEGTDVRGEDCTSQVGDGSIGSVTCSEGCTLEVECSAICGDDSVDDGEECDGNIDLSCADLVGEGSEGEPVCDPTTCKYTVEACTQVYRQITTGQSHTCALKYDGFVRCWGAGSSSGMMGVNHEQSIPPADIKFKSISAGAQHTCGIKLDDDSIHCWGKDDSGQVSGVIPGVYSAISASKDYTCGLESGFVRCWGQGKFSAFDQTENILGIGAGTGMMCILGDDEHILCSGPMSPREQFTSISSGGKNLMCGVPKLIGELPCWGTANDTAGIQHPVNPEMLDLPVGGFKSVNAGGIHACGLDDQNFASCWGEPFAFREIPTDVAFGQISAGGFHTCALTMNGEAECWGANNTGQDVPPEDADRLSGVSF